MRIYLIGVMKNSELPTLMTLSALICPSCKLIQHFTKYDTRTMRHNGFRLARRENGTIPDYSTQIRTFDQAAIHFSFNRRLVWARIPREKNWYTNRYILQQNGCTLKDSVFISKKSIKYICNYVTKDSAMTVLGLHNEHTQKR